MRHAYTYIGGVLQLKEKYIVQHLWKRVCVRYKGKCKSKIISKHKIKNSTHCCSAVFEQIFIAFCTQCSNIQIQIIIPIVKLAKHKQLPFPFGYVLIPSHKFHVSYDKDENRNREREREYSKYHMTGYRLATYCIYNKNRYRSFFGYCQIMWLA